MTLVVATLNQVVLSGTVTGGFREAYSTDEALRQAVQGAEGLNDEDPDRMLPE